MNQSSTRSPGCSRATALDQRRASFFEALLRLRVGLGVDRPRLLPGEVEPAQQPPDPALAVAHPEAALDQLAQVAGAPGDAAVALQLRAPQDQALQGRLPALVERAGPARPRPVAQALDALRVVAVHPVAQGLPVHAGGPRRLLPAHPVQRVGQRQQARADPPVPLAARQRAQLRGRPPLRDRHGDHGPGSRLTTPARLAGQPWPPVKTSCGRYEGGTGQRRDRREALGRSRGGFGTEGCVIADGRGRAVAFALAPGQAREPPLAPGPPRPPPPRAAAGRRRPRPRLRRLPRARPVERRTAGRPGEGQRGRRRRPALGPRQPRPGRAAPGAARGVARGRDPVREAAAASFPASSASPPRWTGSSPNRA